ncbi:MAG: TolC family protein [Planctomycetota bacterium]
MFACARTAFFALVFLSAFVVLTGCSAEHYKESADKQVYEILRKKHEMLFGSEEIYEIEQIARDPMADLPRAEKPLLETPEYLKPFDEPPLIISLEKALEIGTYNSRDYQSEKEDIYVTALSLTEKRHEFSTQFSGIISSFWNKRVGDETYTTESGFSISKLLKTGATIGLNLSTEFLRHLTGDPARTAASVLAVEIIQPLWRGAGRRIATENLEQAERDVVYAIRSFARYKKTFTVSIASSYYRVLQQRDVVRNELSNYNNLIVARDRAEMMAKAGRLPEFQVDQARQDELRAKDRWISALQSYYELLDNFKIDLGLPTDANVDLDDADLQKLVESGITHPEMSAGDAVALALENRLDLKNSEDSVADTERKVIVAKNSLGANVSLVFEAGVPTMPQERFAEFRFDQASWNAGLDIDLPFDRLSERNDYRTALISLARVQRNYGLDVDNVKLGVRQAWRTLQQARESYEIQKISLTLAKRRVDSTTLLLQAGRADTRDLLESQDALLEAQNALVRALTDHTLARLRFYRDIGTFNVDGKGLWQETQNTNEPTESDKTEKNAG